MPQLWDLRGYINCNIQDLSRDLTRDEIENIIEANYNDHPGQGKLVTNYDAGVMMLFKGVPYTMGDDRYRACLGRDVSRDE